jgi:hypothetical protein
MTSHLKRALSLQGNEKQEKLVIIELVELNVKQKPKCEFICAEIVGGYKGIRSKEIACDQDFPCKVESKMVINTQFFLSKGRCQDKSLAIRMLAMVPDQDPIELG